MTPPLSRLLAAETIGAFLLFASVVGSGIMAEHLAGGNVALALLGNTLATGAILYVLVTVFGPVSGAHFNPAVTLVMWLDQQVSAFQTAFYVLVQLGGGILGVWAAHAMFDLPVLQFATKAREGGGQWLGEAIATFSLLLAILGAARFRPSALPAAVALAITAGYWFTSSTSFANPAITLARSLTDTFAGIAPANVLPFILAQIAGALAAFALGRVLFAPERRGRRA